jgi:hypothetical protein
MARGDGSSPWGGRGWQSHGTIVNGTNGNAKYAEQPAADQRTDNPDDDVADKAKAASLRDLPSKPAGDGSDHQENDETCECHAACEAGVLACLDRRHCTRMPSKSSHWPSGG